MEDIYKGSLYPPCVSGPYYVQTTEYIYSNPLVNPHNPFEFIFLRRVNGSNSRDLCRYNFCDNSVDVITQNVNYSLDWSVDDWIIFTGLNLQLWKVKSDGTQLTQLTNTGNFNNHARWNPDGTKYLYYDADLGTSNMRISHADGSLDRILNVYMHRWTWLNNEEILFSTPSDVNKLNLESNVVTHLVSLSGTGVSNMYNKDNSLFLTSSDGFYEFNLVTNELNLIDSTYPSYGALHVHPISEDYLLLNRTISDTSAFAQCTIYQTRYLSLFNRQTMEEKWINIPE